MGLTRSPNSYARLAIAVAILALAALAAPTPISAGLDADKVPSTARSIEMVVLEVEGCVYCSVFRKRMLESYRLSRHGRTIPIRFVDINDSKTLGRVGLTQPIGIVPTFVILENNSEIGRIPGLVGHSEFYRAIEHIVGHRAAF